MTRTPMLPPHATWHLPTRHLGQRVLVFDQIESTNSLALELAAKEEAPGLALLADLQSTGRGQHGRKWLAPPRSSVLLSVLLYPPAWIDRPVLLTALATVAVRTLVHRLTGVWASIKWPNDVYLAGRKVSGILIEQSRQGQRPITVIGIGLNVLQTEEEFDTAGLPEATSLVLHGAQRTDTHDIARELLGILDAQYTLLHDGDLVSLEDSWRSGLGLLGQDVVAECLEEQIPGRLLDCNFTGVSIRTPDGELRQVAPELIVRIPRR